MHVEHSTKDQKLLKSSFYFQETFWADGDCVCVFGGGSYFESQGQRISLKVNDKYYLTYVTEECGRYRNHF